MKTVNVNLNEKNTHVEISLGDEKVMLTLAQAKALGNSILTTAELPGQLAHIDMVFDIWGSGGGGTC